MEELDFVGPFEILSYINKIEPHSTKVLLVSENDKYITAFNGMKVLPETTFEDCPPLDILIVPGGNGRIEAMKNPKIKNFILKQSKNIKYITSICTGVFILAETGLLTGKRVTTHHAALSELEKYLEIKVEKAKVLQDGNVITCAGVSSGIEFGFYLLNLLFGGELAQTVAKKIEYDIDVNNI